MMTTLNPFSDVKDVNLPSLGDVGQTTSPNVASIQIGKGDVSFKADQSGIWLGANKFTNAPFSVDMLGTMALKNIDGDLILSGSGIVGANVYKYGNINGTPGTAFTNTSFTDQESSTLNFITKQTNVRLLVFLSVQSASGQTGAGDMEGRTRYQVILDNSITMSSEILIDSDLLTAVAVRKENIIRKTFSASGILLVTSPGSHNVKLQRMISGATNMTTTLYSFDLTYLMLGA
jgi:hypothetical protein